MSGTRLVGRALAFPAAIAVVATLGSACSSHASSDGSGLENDAAAGPSDDGPVAGDDGSSADAAAMSADSSETSVDGGTSEAGAGAMGGFLGNGVAVDGVKLECSRDSSGACVMPLAFETGGLSYADAVAGLAKNGIDQIVLKVCELNSNSDNNQCPATSTFGQTQRNAVIVQLLTAFANATDPTQPTYIPGYAPHIYLWERWWLWHGSLGTNAFNFADDISSVVSAAYASNLGRMIDGVGVIETQLESSSDVLAQALVVAGRINSDTASLVPGGWLTTHALSFPGGGNGTWFDAIDTQPTSSSFFASMSKQAAHFAFVYKNFPLEKNCNGTSSDNTLCATGITGGDVSGYSHDFVDCLAKSKTISKSAGYLGNFDCTNDVGKKSYMLAPNAMGGLGLSSLESLIASDCGAHPNLTNVMFWGDSADGFSEMSAGNVRVLHGLFVDDTWSVAPGGACGSAGFVVPQAMKINKLSHFAILPAMPASADPGLHILTVSGNDVVESSSPASPNNNTSYTNPMTVWQEWNRWPAVTPSTCTSTAPCY